MVGARRANEESCRVRSGPGPRHGSGLGCGGGGGEPGLELGVGRGGDAFERRRAMLASCGVAVLDIGGRACGGGAKRVDGRLGAVRRGRRVAGERTRHRPTCVRARARRGLLCRRVTGLECIARLGCVAGFGCVAGRTGCWVRAGVEQAGSLQRRAGLEEALQPARARDLARVS